MTTPTEALFVSSRSAMATSGGGVQLCTREYLATVKLAGFRSNIVEYEPDRHPLTRLKRRLRPRPYANLLPVSLTLQVLAAQNATGAGTIFLNEVDLAPLAITLRSRLHKETKIVLLSHGLESVDFLHGARVHAGMTSASARKLGRKLFAECRQREAIDHVFCLAPFEVEIERWLGAKKVDWLPRTLPAEAPLNWQPDPNRLGCVSTLDHHPNREGLVLFLRALEPIAPVNLRFRLVGGPPHSGRELAAQFPCVEYIGALNDAALAAEAKTWSCFVHPLFCYPRGCSTKLAVALGWRIPVVTTEAGRRGYIWGEGEIPQANTAPALARLAVQLLDRAAAVQVREQVNLVAASMPIRIEVAQKLRGALFES